jgi:hypothetical protein
MGRSQASTGTPALRPPVLPLPCGRRAQAAAAQAQAPGTRAAGKGQGQRSADRAGRPGSTCGQTGGAGQADGASGRAGRPARRLRSPGGLSAPPPGNGHTSGTADPGSPGSPGAACGEPAFRRTRRPGRRAGWRASEPPGQRTRPVGARARFEPATRRRARTRPGEHRPGDHWPGDLGPGDLGPGRSPAARGSNPAPCSVRLRHGGTRLRGWPSRRATATVRPGSREPGPAAGRAPDPAEPGTARQSFGAGRRAPDPAHAAPPDLHACWRGRSRDRGGQRPGERSAAGASRHGRGGSRALSRRDGAWSPPRRIQPAPPSGGINPADTPRAPTGADERPAHGAVGSRGTGPRV